MFFCFAFVPFLLYSAEFWIIFFILETIGLVVVVRVNHQVYEYYEGKFSKRIFHLYIFLEDLVYDKNCFKEN